MYTAVYRLHIWCGLSALNPFTQQNGVLFPPTACTVVLLLLLLRYIMTSPPTHDKLSTLLRRHAYFGLQPSQVTLFKCSTAPPAFGGDPLRALQLGAGTLSRGNPGSGEVFAALKSRWVVLSVCGPFCLCGCCRLHSMPSHPVVTVGVLQPVPASLPPGDRLDMFVHDILLVLLLLLLLPAVVLWPR
jgi:hypothetical protein